MNVLCAFTCVGTAYICRNLQASQLASQSKYNLNKYSTNLTGYKHPRRRRHFNSRRCRCRCSRRRHFISRRCRCRCSRRSHFNSRRCMCRCSRRRHFNSRRCRCRCRCSRRRWSRRRWSRGRWSRRRWSRRLCSRRRRPRPQPRPDRVRRSGVRPLPPIFSFRVLIQKKA